MSDTRIPKDGDIFRRAMSPREFPSPPLSRDELLRRLRAMRGNVGAILTVDELEIVMSEIDDSRSSVSPPGPIPEQR
jgi:hypothetical protein